MTGESGFVAIEMPCPACRNMTPISGPELNGVTLVSCRTCGYRFNTTRSQMEELFPDARREGDAWVKGAED